MSMDYTILDSDHKVATWFQNRSHIVVKTLFVLLLEDSADINTSVNNAEVRKSAESRLYLTFDEWYCAQHTKRQARGYPLPSA